MTKVKKVVAVVGIIAVLAFSVIVGYGATVNNNEIWEGRNILPLYVDNPEAKQDEKIEGTFLDDCFESLSIIEEADRELYDKLEEYNSQMEKFYLKEGVDFSDKFEKLGKVYLFENKGGEDQEIEIDGYVEENSSDIYLSKKIVTEGGNYLRDVYIHEINHYLWAKCNDMYYMAEGFAEYVAKQIIGNSYEVSEAYYVFSKFAEQLAIADPEILTYLYNGGSLSDRINNKLEGVEILDYGLTIPPDDLAIYMSELLYLSIYPESSIEDMSWDILQVQHIVIAYCRECNLSKKQIRALNKIIIRQIDSLKLEKDGIYERVWL